MLWILISAVMQMGIYTFDFKNIFSNTKGFSNTKDRTYTPGMLTFCTPS